MSQAPTSRHDLATSRRNPSPTRCARTCCGSQVCCILGAPLPSPNRIRKTPIAKIYRDLHATSPANYPLYPRQTIPYTQQDLPPLLSNACAGWKRPSPLPTPPAPCLGHVPTTRAGATTDAVGSGYGGVDDPGGRLTRTFVGVATTKQRAHVAASGLDSHAVT